MKMRFAKGLFWVQAEYQERMEPLKAGFKWHRGRRLFYSPLPYHAAKLMDHAVDQETRDRIRAGFEMVEASQAATSDASIPCPPGLKYFPFQVAGVQFMQKALAFQGGVLNADEMGIGKTIQTIGVINAGDYKKILVLCPAIAKLTWLREMEKWLVDYYTIGVAQGSKWPTETAVVIANYDIIARNKEAIKATPWDLLVADECHYLKNPQALRSRTVLGDSDEQGIQARHKIFLTGTPILSRPMDIWPALNYLTPGMFGSRVKFGLRYCNGYRDGMAWDFSGASNTDELQYRLRSNVMIRRLKKDVLKELPPKIRQIVEIPAAGNAWMQKALRREMAKVQNYRQQVRGLAHFNEAMAMSDLAQARHETALAKAPAVVEHLQGIVASGQKVICFAWHRDVIETLAKGFTEPAVVTGATSQTARQEAVRRFQEEESCRVFIGNILAAGTNITLTAASWVVFAELDWVPGNIKQAEDRAHRIGQTSSVYVQHLVLEGSIDAQIARVLLRKQQIIDGAVNLESEFIEDEASVLLNLLNSMGEK
jgi:SWI/SNF-related matrix-associated actin-dependent regulator 1 of chromatin subfamily A